MRNRFLTLDERKEIERLISIDSSNRTICLMLQRSKNCIKGEFGRCPKKGYRARDAQAIWETKLKLSGLSDQRIWTDEEKEKIFQMRRNGDSCKVICRFFRCGQKPLNRLLASSDDPVIIGRQGKQKLVNVTFLSLEQRLEALEMQMEIVLDQLRNNGK